MARILGKGRRERPLAERESGRRGSRKVGLAWAAGEKESSGDGRGCRGPVGAVYERQLLAAKGECRCDRTGGGGQGWVWG